MATHFIAILFLFSLPSFTKTSVTILHTNDLHSFFKGITIKEKGTPVRRGGYSRLSHAIKKIRKDLNDSGEIVVLLDAGDFYSGTLFHSLALQSQTPYFPEYEFFSTLKYDGVTLGNHEFDPGDEGFNLLMRKVKGLGNKVPLISTNYYHTENKDYPIVKSKILKRKSAQGELTIGLMGALGPNGCSVSRAARQKNRFVGHDDESAKEKWRDLIKLLNKESVSLKNQGADLVILIFHGGTGEDDKLAKKLKNTDVIIAGHTHEVYQKTVKDTVISQAGSYSQFLGVLPLEVGEKVSLREPHSSLGAYHLKIEEESESDKEYDSRVIFYERNLEAVIKENQFPKAEDFSFKIDKDLDRAQTGKMVTKRVLDELNKEVNDVDFYFSTLGLIRSPLYGGLEYGLEEMFAVLPIGFHNGNKLGHKVVSFYLKDNDVEQLADFLKTYSSFSSTATPVFSEGVEIEYRKWGIPFVNRVKKITIDGKPLSRYVKVATNTFLYDYLDFIKKKTFGLIQIEPVDEKGEPIKKPQIHQAEVYYFLRSF